MIPEIRPLPKVRRNVSDSCVIYRGLSIRIKCSFTSISIWKPDFISRTNDVLTGHRRALITFSWKLRGAINRNCVRYSSVSPILEPLHHVNSLLIHSYNSTMLQIIYKKHKLYRFGCRDVESIVTNSERIRRSMRQRNVNRDTTGRYVASVAPRNFPVAKKTCLCFIYAEFMLPERVPAIIMARVDVKIKPWGKNKPVSNCCHGCGTAKSVKTRETHG